MDTHHFLTSAHHRYSRGFLARRRSRALNLLSSHAVAVQRKWRAQKGHVNVLLLQMAARTMLEQRRSFLEAKLEANQLQYNEAEVGKRKYQRALEATSQQRRGSACGAAVQTVALDAVQAVALKVDKLIPI